MKILNGVLLESGVLAFGADKTGIVDSASALQAALDAADVVHLPPGEYLLSTILVVPSNKTIYGQAVTLRGTLSLAGDNITLQGLAFRGGITNHALRVGGGTALTIDATANRQDINILNCTFEWYGCGITFVSPLLADPTITLHNIRIGGCIFRDLTQHAIALKKEFATRHTNYTVRSLHLHGCIFEDIYHTDQPGAYDGGIYIGGGITVEKLMVRGVTVRNCFTTFITCGSNGYLDQAIIDGCDISGAPAADGVVTHRMGLDLQATRNLVVTGCNFEHFQEECIALFWAENFVVSGCSFRKANIGIGLYAAEGKGCNGTISGCLFADMHDPSGVNSSRYCIVMTEAAHQAQIVACQFRDSAALGMTGLRLEDALQDVIVSSCLFSGLGRGIMAAGNLEWRLSIDACSFYGISQAAITLQHANATVLAGCLFAGCAADFVVSGTVSKTSYLRAANNTHMGTLGSCYTIPNQLDSVFSGNLFRDVGDISTGTGQSSEANRSVWRDNVLAGSTPVEPHNIGRADYLSADGKRIMHNSAPPTSGAWSRGDVVFNTLPTAGGVAGWTCVSSGSPGTWKANGTIAA